MDPQLRKEFFSDKENSRGIPVYPLLLAVSGHRHIEPKSLEIVRKNTAEFLLETGSFWYHKQTSDQKEISPASILVLCGMAAGADQLVAEEVLRLKKEKPELSYKLTAALPMPKKIYEKDFSEGAERLQFLQLLDEADYTIEIPLTNEGQAWLDTHPGESLPSKHRMPQYEKLGQYLAANSLYLLALWDGMEIERIKMDSTGKKTGEIFTNDPIKPDSRGGTADVVRMKMEADLSDNAMPAALAGFPKLMEFSADLPVGSVFHIATPRVKKGFVQLAKDLTPGEFKIYEPYKNLSKQDSDSLSERNRANQNP